jgi:hypothetical protein
VANVPPGQTLRSPTRQVEQSSGRKAILAVTFFFVLVSVSISAGLVVYTAWNHDLRDGLFALAFAVLSAKMAFSWVLWRDDEKEHELPK